MLNAKPSIKHKDIVVEVKDVWESFRIYHQRNQTIKDTLVRWKRSVYEEFWALKGVSFKVHKGETLGIIGENGSGKSTLLKCIAGILQPSKGSIKISGKISPLLELGAGFHPELSGRENIFVNGAILGLTKKQIDERYDDIVEFSGLENFIDTQVKFYSSGMYIRLGFSVAVYSNPDILLIDEILAVGDENFRKKSLDKVKEFQELGKTIILVTHDMGSASKFCDNLLELNKGKIKKSGKPKEVVRDYVNATLQEEESSERGTKEIVLQNIQLLDKDNNECKTFSPGDPLTIAVEFEAKKTIDDPIFGIAIHDQQGNLCYGTNTQHQQIPTGPIESKGNISFSISSLPMLDGKFYVTIAATSARGENYHWLDHCKSFTITSSSNDEGLIYMPIEIDLRKNTALIVKGSEVG